MDVTLIIFAAICLIVGFVGCIAPILPGVPLSYLGLLLLHWTDKVDFSNRFLIIWGIVVVIVQILDYVVPAWGTKQFGGSKMGVWGSTIGLVIGMFAGPLGIILGPFIGAVLFEWIHYKRQEKKNQPNAIKDPNPHSALHLSLRAGFGSFVGLLFGTIMKLICSGMMIYYFIKALI